MAKKKVSVTLYILTLALTATIFIVALFVSNYITKKKTEDLKATEDKITVDLLSLEGQFDLLSDASCNATSSAVSTLDILDEDLENLNSRLVFMESQLGKDNQDVFRLKRYYSLLEIKDYVLRKQFSEQCNMPNVFVLYFYDNENCPLCDTQNIMLKALTNQYPEAHVYAFDYKLDLSAVTTLISLKNIPSTVPVLDIQGTQYGAFQNYDDLKMVIEDQIKLLTATSTATSTATTSVQKANTLKPAATASSKAR